MGEQNGLSLGEVMALTDRNNGGYGCNNGFTDGSWFMWIILLAILFGNGNGFGFGGFGGGNSMLGSTVDGTITREAVNSGFQYNQLDNGIRAVQNGLCDGFYALNNSVTNGFYNTTSAIKDCCCETNRNIDSVKYEMSRGFCDVITAGNVNTRDILENQNAGIQRIIDYLCANEKQNLRDRIQALETSGIVQAQTKNLIDTLRPCPIPAYLTCSPYSNFGIYGANGFGYNGGCGCGCGV